MTLKSSQARRKAKMMVEASPGPESKDVFVIFEYLFNNLGQVRRIDRAP